MGAESAHAAHRALRELVEGSSRARLSLEELELELGRAVPDVPAGQARRALLAEAIGALADRELVRLPRTHAAWQPGRPPLPRLVTRTAGRRAGPASAPARPWRAELAWAAGARLTQVQADALEQVQRWLRDRPSDDPSCGLRERSVDIFSDDKALERLLGGSLFAPGRLTLELLDCRATAPPLVARELPGADPARWLVVENASTFRTLAEHPGALDGAGLLVYGAGGQAPAGLLGLLAERPQPHEVRYFGDVDRDGLRLAAAARDALADDGVDVSPHLHLYRRLAARGLTAPSRARAVTPAAAQELAAWLQESALTAFACEVLTAGRRAMQEQVGPAQLIDDDRGGRHEPFPAGSVVEATLNDRLRDAPI